MAWAQVAGSAPVTALTPAERLAAVQAAGFKPYGKRLVGCDAAPGVPRSQIGLQVLDLNGDGLPEVLINEDNPACYGQPGNAFKLLTRDAGGKWRQIAREVGIPQVLQTKNMGWPDIEIGGPDFGTIPLMGWNGTIYIRKR